MTDDVHMTDPQSLDQSIGKPHPPKKQKQARRKAGSDAAHCWIVLFPLEILAEVLSYVRPLDILRLARTSKYFCATLVSNPSSAFIWKQARAQCLPQPIPDPTPNFTESSFAAFLFDTGDCEMCGKKSKGMYSSFALRLRLCSLPACRTAWISTRSRSTYRGIVTAPRKLEALVPRLETGNTVMNAPGMHQMWVRQEDWRRMIDYSNKMAISDKTARWFEEVESQRLEDRMNLLNEVCRRLMHWKSAYQSILETTLSKNIETAKSIAIAEGWQLLDLKSCPSFRDLLLVKNADLCHMTMDDYRRIASQVQSEMAVIMAKRQRANDEAAAKQRRDAIEQLYDGLKASLADEPMPDVEEFRKLPVIRQMQNCGTSSNAAKEIRQSSLVLDLAKDGLMQWCKEAKSSLRKVLGQSEWHGEDPKTLDPLRRLTTRFRCRVCDEKVKGWSYTGGLSFAEACGHRCQNLSPKVRAKYVWKSERFETDTKAISVLQQLLMWCGYTDNDMISLAAPDEVGTRILCMTCPSPIVMTHDILLRHCRRHESTQVKLLSVNEVDKILRHPIEHGMAAKLTKRLAHTRFTRDKRIYGCRHCESAQLTQRTVPTGAVSTPMAEAGSAHGSLPLPTVRDEAESSGKPRMGARGSQLRAGGPTAEKMKAASLFTFDGMRSHAKEKHGILWLGDEDFYRQLCDDDDE